MVSVSDSQVLVMFVCLFKKRDVSSGDHNEGNVLESLCARMRVADLNQCVSRWERVLASICY